ncbi:MAG: hypothetical protein M0Q90_04240 [Bacteroidales bacterium]|nr:hypothetical protein [Bacteroidales bacterium]
MMTKFNFKPILLIFFLVVNNFIFAQVAGDNWTCQTIGQNNKSIILGKAPFTTNTRWRGFAIRAPLNPSLLPLIISCKA